MQNTPKGGQSNQGSSIRQGQDKKNVGAVGGSSAGSIGGSHSGDTARRLVDEQLTSEATGRGTVGYAKTPQKDSDTNNKTGRHSNDDR